MRLSMRPSLLRALALLLLIAAPGAAVSDPPRVHVIVTQRAPVVDRLLLDVERAFANQARLEITDLKGSVSGAKDLVHSIAGKLGDGDIVLALGAPAARAATAQILNHPVVCAMTTSSAVSKSQSNASKVFFAGGDPSVDSLVKALGSVFKRTGKVAVITGRPERGDQQDARVLWQKVGPSDDLLRTLDSLADHVDGFVFPREATVLNRRNIDQVIEWLAREGKPAIGYSRFLVTAGFPAALGTDDASARRRVISILKALLEGTEVPAEGPEGAIWLNRKSLESLGVDPSGLTVVAQLL